MSIYFKPPSISELTFYCDWMITYLSWVLISQIIDSFPVSCTARIISIVELCPINFALLFYKLIFNKGFKVKVLSLIEYLEFLYGTFDSQVNLKNRLMVSKTN